MPLITLITCSCGIYPADVVISVYLRVFVIYLQDYCFYLQIMPKMLIVVDNDSMFVIFGKVPVFPNKR